MLITNHTSYTIKPYIVTKVGYAKFIMQPRYNVLIIVIDNSIDVYRNGKILGMVYKSGRIYTASLKQQEPIARGRLYNTENDIPFYDFGDRLSIFGFSILIYPCENCGNYLQFDELREKVLQI